MSTRVIFIYIIFVMMGFGLISTLLMGISAKPMEQHSDFEIKTIEDMKKYEIGYKQKWNIQGIDYELTLYHVDFHWEKVFQDPHINNGSNYREEFKASAYYRDDTPKAMFVWILFWIAIGIEFVIISFVSFGLFYGGR